MQQVYLDNNATTRPADEVVEAMLGVLREHWANPSSVHRAGQGVRQRLELARESVCRLIGCQPRELLFTSGGTEASNLAIRGSLDQLPDRRVLLTSRIEHSATRETAEQLEERGIETIWLSLDAQGVFDADQLALVLAERADEIALVSLQWANNETGAIQPIERIGSLCRDHGVRFHCDATQCVGKMPVDVSGMPLDLMTLSAHKFHGPKGVGALYVRRGVRLPAGITGGPQERERRGGTENTPGIIGMGRAAELAQQWLAGDGCEQARALRDRFEQALCNACPDAKVNQSDVDRLWNTSNIAFSRLEAEAILLLLSERGICASAGAACSSGSLDPSPVLLAMGIQEELAHGSIRFSISHETTEAEIDRAIEVVPQVIERLQRSAAPV